MFQKDIIKDVRIQINSGDFDGALFRISHIVNSVITEPLCTASIYSSPSLDQLCSEIGLAVFKSQGDSIKKVLNDTVVVVASRLQASGGHTRVIEDFFRILPHKNKYILITDWVGGSDRANAEDRFKPLGVHLEYSPKGSPLSRLLWLQKRLFELNAQQVYLFNHHEDSIAVAAMEACRESDIHFYHHGDHHLCLGAHLKGATHIDIHAFGYHNCRYNLNISDNTYLPLIVEDRGVRSLNEPFIPGGRITTCTAAGWNKLGLPHSVNYITVIPILLASTGGRHIHIGHLPRWVRWHLNRAMRKMGVDLSSFVYIPRVSSVWDALIENRVDLYLSSFPITGGRTMVEVMGAGVPIAVHDHPTSRFLGGLDMAYPEAFNWREIDVLVAICRNVTPCQLEEHGIHARTHYMKYHHPMMLQGALLEQRTCKPPPIRNMVYVEDELQSALDIARAAKVRSIAHKFLYRTFKKLRSLSSQWI